MTTPLIDEAFATELDAIMQEELDIAAAQAVLDERTKANRARLLAQTEAWTRDGKSILPGVVLTSKSSIETDYVAALRWAIADDQRMLALASVLTINDAARFTVVQRATDDPSLKAILALDKSKYDGALREDKFKLMEGQPPYIVERTPVISVKTNAVKTGNDLRKALGLPDAPTADSEDVF